MCVSAQTDRSVLGKNAPRTYKRNRHTPTSIRRSTRSTSAHPRSNFDLPLRQLQVCAPDMLAVKERNKFISQTTDGDELDPRRKSYLG